METSAAESPLLPPNPLPPLREPRDGWLSWEPAAGRTGGKSCLTPALVLGPEPNLEGEVGTVEERGDAGSWLTLTHT